MISVIIAAHNESSVIARTLRSIVTDATVGEVDVVVICNGCTDSTASVARGFGPFVRVIETETLGKAHALNLGDEVAAGFPRIYVDADVVITTEAIRTLARRLERGDVLAAAPTAKYDLAGCSWVVRAFYEVRSHLPSALEGIGGSGVYALSEVGRQRFSAFPILTADDGYVRIQFDSEERETLLSVSSIVFPPRTTKDLIATKTRAHYGSFELASRFPSQWKNRGASNNRALIGLLKRCGLWPKLAAYCYITTIARRRAQGHLSAGTARWERDETSRASALPTPR